MEMLTLSSQDFYIHGSLLLNKIFFLEFINIDKKFFNKRIYNKSFRILFLIFLEQGITCVYIFIGLHWFVLEYYSLYIYSFQ